MQYPQFIAIDGSSFEEYAQPVAIAWSLANGQIKTTLITPDEDWEDECDSSLQDMHGITPDTLYERGETTIAVIRELEADLTNPYLFADDPTRVEALLSKIYESCSRELSIEIGDYREIVTDTLLDEYAHYQIACDERAQQLLKDWAAEHESPLTL